MASVIALPNDLSAGTTDEHRRPRRRHAATSGSTGLDVQASRSPIMPLKAVQRDTSKACADCGGPVVRARRARGPLPARCHTCTAARRPLRQLRAYLRSAARLAARTHRPDVETAVDTALAVLDAGEPAR